MFERREAVGGLLRFGIPNFKLNKAIIDRRIDVMKAEGITFEVNADIDILNLPKGFDAYAVCTGTPQAGQPRRATSTFPDATSTVCISRSTC